MNPLPKLTIICPVHDEEEMVNLFFERTKNVLDEVSGRYEGNLLFIDNASRDNTRAIVTDLCHEYPFVYLISLTANFGYQVSIECGLRNAKGDLFVVIDVDCEDPPEMIMDFLDWYEQGWDIVYGERVDRHEPRIIKWLRKLYYRLTRVLSDDDFVTDMAEFCLLTSEVREAIQQDRSSYPFIRASIGRVGFNRKGIPYKRQKRIAGESHYNLIGMTIFGIGGILSSSTLILRISAYVFPIWALTIATLGIVQIFYSNIWSIPLLLILGFLFCGYTSMGISIYVARTYKNGLRRPNYFINKKQSLLQS